jgi:hypothetical protein
LRKADSEAAGKTRLRASINLLSNPTTYWDEPDAMYKSYDKPSGVKVKN